MPIQNALRSNYNYNNVCEQFAKKEPKITVKLYYDEVNDFNLEVRYPDYKHDFYRRCTKEYVEPYFIKIKEYYQWFKSQLTLETPSTDTSEL